MPRPTSVTVSSATQSAWIPSDYKQTPFNVGLGVVVSGTLTYTVEHTFDDIQDPSVTPTAFDNAGLVSQTANNDGNYAFPVRAIRLNVTAFTSGDATLTIIQGS